MEVLPGDLWMVVMVDDKNQQMIGSCIFGFFDKVQVKLYAFSINQKQRNKGYGKKMMHVFLNVIKQMAFEQVHIDYRTYWNANKHWMKILDQTGWSDPELRFYYVTMPDVKVQFGKSWLTARSIEAPYTVETWNKNSFNQLKATLMHKDWQGVVRKQLNPFQLAPYVVPHCSLLLKKEGEVVGWLICHMLQENVVQGTTLFVHPDKAKGTGLALLGEAFKRRKLGARVLFIVEKDNTPMLNLINKYVIGGEAELFEKERRFFKLN